MGLGAVGKLTVMFGADMKGLNRGMKKAQRNLSKFSKTMTRNLVLPMVAFAGASVKAFDTQIKAETKLLTALKGKEDVQKRLIEQAQHLQSLTLFGDEETIAAQSMLATMGLEEEAISRLIPLVQDMAVAKGMNLVQAADLVAKSVGSSTNALSRYGIEITGAVGSTERLDSAVGSLTQMFEGQAQAIAKEGLGPLIQLKNTLGDVAEQFGEIILHGLTPFTEKMKAIGESLKLLTPEQKQFIVTIGGITIAITGLIAGLGLLAGAVTSIIAFFTSFGAIPIVAGLTGISVGVGFLIKKFRDKGGLKESIKETNQEMANFNITFDKFGRIQKKYKDTGFRMMGVDSPTTTTTNSGKKENNRTFESLIDVPSKFNIPEYERGWKTFYKNIEKTSNMWDDATKKVKEFNDEIRMNFEGAMYGAMTSQENFFDAFISNFKRVLGQMAAARISENLTSILFGALTLPAGGGIGGFLGKILGLSNGGLVTGPTLAMVGEGGSTVSNPEVVAPLDKLRSMMGGSVQKIEVEGRLSGRDIFLSNSKTSNSRFRST